MPKGVCDPSPAAYNELGLAVADGQVSITVLWAWDGVSVWPDCDGPIVSIRLVNNTDQTFTALLPNARKPGTRQYTIQPHADITINAPGTLKNLGLETIRDTDDFNLVIL